MLPSADHNSTDILLDITLKISRGSEGDRCDTARDAGATSAPCTDSLGRARADDGEKYVTRLRAANAAHTVESHKVKARSFFKQVRPRTARTFYLCPAGAPPPYLERNDAFSRCEAIRQI